MLVEVNPLNPDNRHIDEISKKLKLGAIIIYPTDTVYSIGCDFNNKKAITKLANLKGIKLRQSNFSIICENLSNISNYTTTIDRNVFKLLKKSLPGPFTFILPANKIISKIFDYKKSTIGIRVPNNKIINEIVKTLGNPIITTSIHDDDEILEYSTDPYAIYEKYHNKVDYIIDGGYGHLEASTVVDCTEETPNIVRQGKGIIEL